MPNHAVPKYIGLKYEVYNTTIVLGNNDYFSGYLIRNVKHLKSQHKNVILLPYVHNSIIFYSQDMYTTYGSNSG